MGLFEEFLAAHWPQCENSFVPLSQHWNKNMATIHDQIDELLAADVHDQLSENERDALHTHLVECAHCRRLHQESKIMNNVLEENLTSKKADPAFEQRMIAGFRNR